MAEHADSNPVPLWVQVPPRLLERDIMSKFIIVSSWTMYAETEVEAASLEDAIDIVEDGNLPDVAEYINGSFQVDIESSHKVKGT